MVKSRSCPNSFGKVSCLSCNRSCFRLSALIEVPVLHQCKACRTAGKGTRLWFLTDYLNFTQAPVLYLDFVAKIVDIRRLI